MHTEETRSGLAKLEQKYPDQLLVIRSPKDLENALYTRNYQVLNGEPYVFKNNDPSGDILGIIGRALSSGKQVSIQAAGDDSVLVNISKSGKALFSSKRKIPV